MRFSCLPLLAVLLVAGTAGAQDALDCHFAPGWEQSGQKRQYTADNLYDYKDGGAEGYLIFGFSRMTGITCKSGQDTLDMDVSEMNDPEAAWGIFAANFTPDRPIEKLGMGGQIGKQSAAFAKGKYYVELVEVAANPESDQSVLLRTIAARILARIEGADTQPEALAWFPAGAVPPIRLIPESVLGLKQLKREFVAKYAEGQAFVASETSPEAAAEVFRNLREHFADAGPAADAEPISIGDEAFQANDKYLGALCIFRKGRILAGYANLPGKKDAIERAGQLMGRIP